jgi:hypothetical protein
VHRGPVRAGPDVLHPNHGPVMRAILVSLTIAGVRIATVVAQETHVAKSAVSDCTALAKRVAGFANPARLQRTPSA